MSAGFGQEGLQSKAFNPKIAPMMIVTAMQESSSLTLANMWYLVSAGGRGAAGQ